ncbi:K(+)/H(+) antiporter NhaP2 [Pseudoalteromonas sp. P1-9]|uniref:cation:proton antiporter domain-containing protein n=1 Tax=Pseudoalteromonas sp. P1-9 TaxID=1710354 RepID=UPI0006D612A6|nr:cation:proton antiporter [Pseudoalteromonas sp. P1-9]KPV95663.1 K(+)/H(+) antiporter NhaP2 [Pseudoalteromonas sp. P1-9]
MENEYAIFVAVTSLVIVYSLFAKRIGQVSITGPMFMLFFGFCFAYFFRAPNHLEFDVSAFQIYIELTLALILFGDAAKAKISVLTHSYVYPLLLLLIAMPLTFLFGTYIGTTLFPDEPFIHLALLAIILTPTDAALSSNFIDNQKIPAQTREAVNVESGLNDGLAVPVFLLLLYSASNQQTLNLTNTLMIAAKEIGVAVIVAVVVSVLVFKLVIFSEKYRLYNKHNEVFICVAIAILIFLIAQLFGGSGFFAAFIAGLLFDYKFKKAFKPQRLSNAHALANTCALIIWFIFGNFAFSYLVDGVSLLVLLYSLFALTIMRIIPVLLSLLFTQLNLKQRFLLAWFGPRGLASVVFTLILLQQLDGVSDQLVDVAILTIILSVFFHGISSRVK